MRFHVSAVRSRAEAASPFSVLEAALRATLTIRPT